MNARLQHVAVPRPPGSEAETRRFYGGVLGLTEITPARSMDELDLIWFSLGDAEIHLYAEPPTGQDRTGRHFCLVVDDLEDVRGRLEAAGIPVVGTVPIPGRPRYYARDPFGNLIEFSTIEETLSDSEVGP